MAETLDKEIIKEICSSGDKTTSIPAITESGSNALSFAEGFPIATSTPQSDGGIPPKRTDMNKVLNYLSKALLFLQNGGIYSYDSNVSTAIGGYPLNAIVEYTDTYGNTFKIKSLVANNTNAPSLSNIKFNTSGSGTYYWEAIQTGSPLNLEYFAICQTAANQQEKVVNIPNFAFPNGDIPKGTKVRVMFVNGNTYSGLNLSLKITGVSGSISNPMKVAGVRDSIWNKMYVLNDEVVEFWWTGYYWKTANIVVDEEIGTYNGSPDGTWYRIYRSGWVEQGGLAAAGNGEVTVTLHIPMSDSNYHAIASNYMDNSDSGSHDCRVYARTTTTIKLAGHWVSSNNKGQSNVQRWWCVRGYKN